MNNQDLQTFLNIIDGRIKKYINENKLLKQYCARITGFVENNNFTKYKARLLGDEEEFVFLNKTGESLEIGDFVYIQTVGTDLNTGVIIYKTKESLGDFIIEQGTTGIWTYEKWASGKAVCYGKKNYGTMATHAWGYLFETDGMNIDFPSGLFIENPQVMHVDFLYGGGIGGFIERGAVAPTKDSIGEFCVARTSQLTYSNLTIGFYIVGKWK